MMRIFQRVRFCWDIAAPDGPLPPAPLPEAGRGERVGRAGFTIIELLVVLSIITILLSLSLPAVQAVRERGRNTQCQNKLRQITLALQNFEAAHRQYPSDGWGWAWVGDRSIRNGEDGPGGWVCRLLPYLEMRQLWSLTESDQGRAEAIATPIPILACPSRRDGLAYPYTLEAVPLRNCEVPAVGSRSDYAICAGDELTAALAGPVSRDRLEAFGRPAASTYSGMRRR